MKEMQDLIPHHVNERESDNRCIKEVRWYAMRRNGTLRFGPFASRDQCAVKITHANEK